MLFKSDVLERIASGEVTLAFRRWKRPTVKPGGRLRTAIGVLHIGAVGQIAAEDVNDRDAQAAGYPWRDAVLKELGEEDRGALFRVELKGVEPDERVRLRAAADLSEMEWASIRARFDRWERTAPGYRRAILEAIADRPATAAGILAATLGVDKLRFKRDVHGLKELGLTESLETGYRLSRRGMAVLERLKGEA